MTTPPVVTSVIVGRRLFQNLIVEIYQFEPDKEMLTECGDPIVLSQVSINPIDLLNHEKLVPPMMKEDDPFRLNAVFAVMAGILIFPPFSQVIAKNRKIMDCHFGEFTKVAMDIP